MKKTISTLTIAALVFGLSYSLVTKSEETNQNTDQNIEDIVKTKSSGAVEYPSEDFNNQIKEGVVILDFFSTSCPPCRRFLPVFTSTATKYIDILFIKVDINQYSQLTKEYGIRSIPTIVALKDGKEIKRSTGAMSIGQFESWINKLT